MALYKTLRTFATVLIVSLSFHLNAQQIIFSDNFEEGSFRPEWQISPGQPNGAIEVFPSNTLEGEYAARLGKSNDGDYALNRLDLPIDLSGGQLIMLQLMIYNNQEETHVQDGIFLSVDGGASFEKIVSFRFEDWPQKYTGTLAPIHINALARAKGLLLSKQSIIRIQQYGKDDFIGGKEFSDGIYIDKVEVIAHNPEYASLPFKENFNSGQLSSSVLKGDPMLSDSSGITSPTSVIEIIDFDSTQGKVLRMGSRLDKSPATNALDLYLNLASQQFVKLKFDIYDNRDETHPADGILFSDDGGYSFHKVFAFDPDHWSDNGFGSFPPLDVNTLALKYGLKLSEHFVIRFQQHDDDDFEGSRLSSDGLIFDNFHIYNAVPSYATLPFNESFDDTPLASYWQEGSPSFTSIVKPNGIVEIVTMEDGNRAVRLGSSADKSYTTNALDLYLNLKGRYEAELSFRYYDNYDETHEQDGIFFSNDGGKSFKKVFDFDGDNWTDKQFGKIKSLNIQELSRKQQLELTENFVIRFQQYDDDDFEGTRTISDGIYLDDISVVEPERFYANIPFSENFEDTLASHWRYGNPMLTTTIQNIKPGGMVQIVDSIGCRKSKGLAIGRREDGKQTTNSIDLHLNLDHQQNLQLNFLLNNNYDEIDEEDGLWFSNDGGKSFKKAWNFPEFKGKYKAYSLNFDSLVTITNHRFSNQFVIRFQQSGSRKFSGMGNLKGGIYIDNITVAQNITKPEILWPPDSTQLTECGVHTFSWTKTPLAENYQMQIYTYKGGNEVIVQDTIITEVSHTVKNLIEDSAYYCKVKAFNTYTSSKWSSPVAFRTFSTFEADLQISGKLKEENKVILQASEFPSYEYQWYKNGEPLNSKANHRFTVDEPGKYTVFISNKICGMMSPTLEISPSTLGFIEDYTKNDAELSFPNMYSDKSEE
ncbi:fibronectin type III domain-containing protein [Catalinimonas niigatensis]|uniref:fibronectin type III domain-containing protein n=1 Tax=Catalinimonas niigatensis TaxID=1397264 RepID=UPI00266645C0|nr:hypothetical protein [Catalinimonas niigatensis]WPP53077.1 hypothetical protein PZB72_11890 [Catalinimonas niigatensis]